MHLREWLGSEKLKLKGLIVHWQQRQATARDRHLPSSAAGDVLACSPSFFIPMYFVFSLVVS